MRRLYLLAALFAAGCGGNLVGPFQRPDPLVDRVDHPIFSIEEQKSRGRERLALPDESKEVAPHSGVELPGPHGR